MNRTSIIIVNWNTRDLVLRCVDSVRRHTPELHELILVDNGSCDGSAEELRALEGPLTRVLLLPQNVGFAAGCNQGIALAQGTAVCLLNSDTQVTRGWLGSLWRALERTGAGLVGPYSDHAKGWQRRRPWWGVLPPPFRRTRETKSLSFFCVLIRREVLDRVGLLDERFGLGTWEDDDYCHRAREAGFRLFIDGGSWVWHEAHATFRANRLDDRGQQEVNRRVFEEKWKDR
jgi:GT2 family glycosyltransferase